MTEACLQWAVLDQPGLIGGVLPAVPRVGPHGTVLCVQSWRAVSYGGTYHAQCKSFRSSQTPSVSDRGGRRPPLRHAAVRLPSLPSSSLGTTPPRIHLPKPSFKYAPPRKFLESSSLRASEFKATVSCSCKHALAHWHDSTCYSGKGSIDLRLNGLEPHRLKQRRRSGKQEPSDPCPSSCKSHGLTRAL
jgi:hypothetical protein